MIYAIQTFMRVRTLDEGKIPFKIFEQQRRALLLFQQERYILGYKSRQVGFTTIMAVFAAYQVVFARKNKPENVVIICNHLETAQKILRLIKEFIEYYPLEFIEGHEVNYNSKSQVPPQYKKNNEKSIELKNGSTVRAVACKTGIRSESTSLVLIDEAAFLQHPRPDEFLKGLYMTMSSSSIAKCVMSSTPNGLDPIYHKEYRNAKEGGKYKIAKLRWECDPRYNKGLKWQKFDDEGELIDEIEDGIVDDVDHILAMIDKGYEGWSYWFEYQCTEVLDNDERSINSELKLKFVGSAGNVIDPKFLKKIESKTKEPLSKEDFKESAWIYRYAEKGCKYILAADVGRGDGGDYSTFYILNAETYDICVEFRAIIDESSFAVIINKYGLKYNALVIVEVSGGYGGITINTLENMGYPHLYYEKTSQDPFSNIETIEMVEKNDGGRAGFIITAKNRHTLTTKVQNMIEQEVISVDSERLYGELTTWIWDKKGRADHQRSAHDDLIMALGVGLYVLEYVLKEIEQNDKADLERMEAILNINNKKNRDIREVRTALIQPNVNHMNDPLYYDPTKSFYGQSTDIPQITHADVFSRYRAVKEIQNNPKLKEAMRKLIEKKGLKNLLR